MQHKIKVIGRFLVDWRNGLVVVGSIFLVFFLFAMIDGSRSREQAYDLAQTEIEQTRAVRAAATNRINLLQGQIVELTSALEESKYNEGESATTAQALEQQLRSMGVVPVTTVQGRDDFVLSPTIAACLKNTPN